MNPPFLRHIAGRRIYNSEVRLREKSVLRKWKTPTIVDVVLALIGWPYAQSADPSIGGSIQEALAIGTDAYIYG
jgi:hypothetical protein